MDLEKDLEVDEKEMVKQLRKRIIRSGNYSKIELVVGKEIMPYTSVKIHGTGEILSRTIIALEALTEQLKEQYPMQYLLGKISYGVKAGGTINMKDKEEEQE